MTAMRLSAFCLVIVALVAAVAAVRMGVWRSGAPGPGLFPLSAALLLLVASLGVAVQTGPEDGAQEPVDRPRLLRYGAAIAVFGLVLKPLGAVVATVGLLVAILRGVERQPWAFSFGIALTLAFLSWAVFRHLLGVPLPRGILGL